MPITRRKKKQISAKEKFYVTSQWQLMWRKFKKHRLAMIGGTILVILYFGALLCEFFAPYLPRQRYRQHMYAPPQRVKFFDEEGFHLRPFVYELKGTRDPVTWKTTFVEDKSKKYPIYFFIRGDEYKLWNIFPTDIHLFGVENGAVFLFGTDSLGRDLFSRNLYASRLSLSIGLIGVFISLILGCALGGISGYYSGKADVIIQRIIELLMCIPAIPLWMALSAALPPHWSVIKTYFSITIILSIVGWTGLARTVRGKFLELREEEFVIAAKIAGAGEIRTITRHLLPSFLSYVIVSATLAIPGMILGETALSFIGIGMRPPAVSWGVLLHDTQNVRSIMLHSWLLVPAVFVIIVVLAFNFLGDGLRDAADPYK